ncbi:hypothetical protein BDQ12DRAFT_673182 [Crucibulum laeve]|uniref:Uncharacterized protein n=1 Tax=Crucibulum laeve TaxID=68775 RepID=A0A5C3MGR1_9AGAR|nr:hypothetical protein BDQ12DRAFT_673182 [Crucibulum laeve]
MSVPPTSTQKTLLTSVQKFHIHDTLPTSSIHPFTASAEHSCALLNEIIQSTEQISNSLSAYQSAPWSNPKLVTLLRQHTASAHVLHLAERNINYIADSLHKRAGVVYGESIPLDPTLIPEWCISRLEAWGKLAGMETFKDDSKEGVMTVMLAGKVLVVDVDFSFQRETPDKPTVRVASVKTSYAISNNASGSASNTNGSSSLDGFLAEYIQKFCTEVQKADDLRDPEEAWRLGHDVFRQLRYLVMLDKLASANNEFTGIRWFVDIDGLCPVLEKFAKSEAEIVISSLSTARAPLDIFLLRSHALPLPYLVSPSISFLVSLSPLSYLSLFRSLTSSPTEANLNLPNLDIPLPQIRSYLTSSPKGATVATLSLTTTTDAQLFPASISMPNITSRPTFPLVSSGSELEHVFPQLSDPSDSIDATGESKSMQHLWVLDFTAGGKNRGVVMSQSRMRDIELVVNPLAGMDHLDTVDLVPFGYGSWLDLLLNPGNESSPERYIALYTSPSSAHPPLELRLTAPEEPGFLLEKVPVHSMKEIWGILEIVREQCWLNEVLAGCNWTTEGLDMEHVDLPKESEPTEDELQSVLSGSFIPRKIPVNVYLPSTSGTNDTLFGTDLETIRRPRIVMTAPEPSPISGLIEITVSYDETKPRGIAIEVQGAMGADIKVDVLEERSRRGGTLGLPGNVWATAHTH